ncbi:MULTISPECIES: dCTP deaminase [Pseudomonas]|uniref:Deoxycytidine deaminase n=4 Tax=Pseudomonas syringae group TaxID=136849 RepID=Q0EDZ3_PSESF|nr:MULTISPECIES: hypothetical protein [Pseudomonas]EPN27957.1 deoxycytidine triphosphate deaminase [Pseudomonas syringae pv. actinidiae ICMP 19070]KPB82609.1 Deoxycytidine triphosphate deaminase DCTP deaminase [Pseudomonas syringae pv. maculicola]AAZ36732.1 Deoxycytidine triphosphate deaminase (dCTP deaminase) [Pseudomonas savastanoi pv. phaseolicola 1448A]AQL39533.1 deoxycytidine triphosphate deaminase [Pseudomonas syringae pv. actinidiae ICMP 9853]EGH66965.1 deoxycytidine triphosphate deamin
MMLTGSEIQRMRELKRIVIEPFDPRLIEQNSYACHLGSEIIEYDAEQIDPHEGLGTIQHTIPEEGLVLQPRRFYLGSTVECIGGLDFASELYANLSTALCGMFIQTSAPLGHTGATICWTLEIVVTQPLRIYAGTKIAKVCFWKNFGAVRAYEGRYAGSQSVVPSRIIMDQP